MKKTYYPVLYFENTNKLTTQNHQIMSKFLLTGCLLLLLASFLNYPARPTNVESKQKRESVIIFPISEQIKLARMESQLTLKELATRIGITKMNMERIEKGQIVPSPDVLEKMEKELGVRLDLNGY